MKSSRFETDITIKMFSFLQVRKRPYFSPENSSQSHPSSGLKKGWGGGSENLCPTLWGALLRALGFRSFKILKGLCSTPSPCHHVVSLDKKLYPTLSLSTQVYKMGTGDILLAVTL